MSKDEQSIFLNSVLNHILNISKGNCTLTSDFIYSHKNETHREILEGLLFLHEDLELYKIELREAMEKEYKIKILEEKNKQLEQFNYAASHDLKEPLRTISSFSGLALRSNKDNLDEEGKEYLQYVIEASKRMWNLITGLSNYTEVGSKRTLSMVDIRKLVDNVCLDLSAQIKEKNVRFEIDDMPTIMVFEIELRQLFQNLISNALKFNKLNQGLLIKIEYQKLEGVHQFLVQDNGIGISPHQHNTIFEIFKRLNRKDEYEGTGIGLALCQRIVAMHYGKIWVESELGKGSKFLFTIAENVDSSSNVSHFQKGI